MVIINAIDFDILMTMTMMMTMVTCLLHVPLMSHWRKWDSNAALAFPAICSAALLTHGNYDDGDDHDHDNDDDDGDDGDDSDYNSSNTDVICLKTKNPPPPPFWGKN